MTKVTNFDLTNERFVAELSALKETHPGLHQSLDLFFDAYSGAPWSDFVQDSQLKVFDARFDSSVVWCTFQAVQGLVVICAALPELEDPGKVIPLYFQKPAGLGPES